MVHYKIVHCIVLKTCIFLLFPQILSFSSNRKAQNSAPSFQFMTLDRELTQKSTKNMKSQHFHLLKETKFRPHRIICNPGPVNWQKSMQNGMNFHTFQHLHSVTPLKSMKTITHRKVYFQNFALSAPKALLFKTIKQCT